MADDDSVRARLLTVIQAAVPGFPNELTDGEPLLQSGLLDSLGLFNVAIFVEAELGQPVDLGSFDLATDWNTLGGILAFVRARRVPR
jgi:acyl carrier protein